MAAALPYIALFGTAVAAGEQMEAASDAKNAAKANAKAIQAETAEEARRLQAEQKETEATTRARAAASGAGGASRTAYQNRMSTEHARELAWLKKSGDTQAKLAIQQGNQTASSIRSNAFGTLASGAMSFYGTM